MVQFRFAPGHKKLHCVCRKLTLVINVVRQCFWKLNNQEIFNKYCFQRIQTSFETEKDQTWKTRERCDKLPCSLCIPSPLYSKQLFLGFALSTILSHRSSLTPTLLFRRGSRRASARSSTIFAAFSYQRQHTSRAVGRLPCARDRASSRAPLPASRAAVHGPADERGGLLRARHGRRLRR